MTALDVNHIKQLLPHRYPFLLLDKVVDCEPGVSLRAVKNVTANEPFFPGHFPTQPIMPGVLIVEAMAQASAVLGLLSQDKEAERQHKLYYLVGVDKARFRKTVRPGDQLLVDVKLAGVRRNIWRFSCSAEVADMTVADAELLTTIAEPDV